MGKDNNAIRKNMTLYPVTIEMLDDIDDEPRKNHSKVVRDLTMEKHLKKMGKKKHLEVRSKYANI